MSLTDFNECYSFLEKFAVLQKTEQNEILIAKSVPYLLTNDEIIAEAINFSLNYLVESNCPKILIPQIIKNIVPILKLNMQENPKLNLIDSGLSTLKQLTLKSIEFFCRKLLNKVELETLLSKNRCIIPISVYGTIKNRRRFMEDRHICLDNYKDVYQIENCEDASFYAVFDGHDGYNASTYSCSQLPYILAKQKSLSSNPIEALKQAFVETDFHFIQKNVKGGSTAVCALYLPESLRLYVAWVGDSKALLCKQGKILQIVDPHKPENLKERERICNAGGSVLNWDGTWRVDGLINLSRTIGNSRCKPYLTADPDIVEVELDQKEDFLILACDGLWDHVKEENVALMTYECLLNDFKNFENIPEILIESAKKGGSSDNITIVVILFKHPKHISQSCADIKEMDSHSECDAVEICNQATGTNTSKQTFVNKQAILGDDLFACASNLDEKLESLNNCYSIDESIKQDDNSAENSEMCMQLENEFIRMKEFENINRVINQEKKKVVDEINNKYKNENKNIENACVDVTNVVESISDQAYEESDFNVKTDDTPIIQKINTLDQRNLAVTKKKLCNSDNYTDNKHSIKECNILFDEREKFREMLISDAQIENQKCAFKEIFTENFVNSSSTKCDLTLDDSNKKYVIECNVKTDESSQNFTNKNCIEFFDDVLENNINKAKFPKKKNCIEQKVEENPIQLEHETNDNNEINELVPNLIENIGLELDNEIKKDFSIPENLEKLEEKQYENIEKFETEQNFTNGKKGSGNGNTQLTKVFENLFVNNDEYTQNTKNTVLENISEKDDNINDKNFDNKIIKLESSQNFTNKNCIEFFDDVLENNINKAKFPKKKNCIEQKVEENPIQLEHETNDNNEINELVPNLIENIGLELDNEIKKDFSIPENLEKLEEKQYENIEKFETEQNFTNGKKGSGNGNTQLTKVFENLFVNNDEYTQNTKNTVLENISEKDDNINDKNFDNKIIKLVQSKANQNLSSIAIEHCRKILRERMSKFDKCDESDDEWNYMQIKENEGEKQETENSEKLIKFNLPTKDNLVEQINKVLGINITDDIIANKLNPTNFEIDNIATNENMNYQLNPDAEEFIPTSPPDFAKITNGYPKLQQRFDIDDVVAQSPRKDLINMENIQIPEEKKFDEEAAKRPHEVDEQSLILNEVSLPTYVMCNENCNNAIVKNTITTTTASNSLLVDFNSGAELEKFGMNLSIYIENQIETESINELDLLNTVQTIPDEIKENSLVEEEIEKKNVLMIENCIEKFENSKLEKGSSQLIIKSTHSLNDLNEENALNKEINAQEMDLVNNKAYNETLPVIIDSKLKLETSVVVETLSNDIQKGISKSNKELSQGLENKIKLDKTIRKTLTNIKETNKIRPISVRSIKSKPTTSIGHQTQKNQLVPNLRNVLINKKTDRRMSFPDSVTKAKIQTVALQNKHSSKPSNSSKMTTEKLVLKSPSAIKPGLIKDANDSRIASVKGLSNVLKCTTSKVLDVPSVPKPVSSQNILVNKRTTSINPKSNNSTPKTSHMSINLQHDALKNPVKKVNSISKVAGNNSKPAVAMKKNIPLVLNSRKLSNNANPLSISPKTQSKTSTIQNFTTSVIMKKSCSPIKIPISKFKSTEKTNKVNDKDKNNIFEKSINMTFNENSEVSDKYHNIDIKVEDEKIETTQK